MREDSRLGSYGGFQTWRNASLCLLASATIAIMVWSGVEVLSHRKRKKWQYCQESSYRQWKQWFLGPVAANEREEESCIKDDELNMKPQRNFQVVLADNSPTPFKHLVHEGHDLKDTHPYGAEIQRLIKNPAPPPYLSALDEEPPPLEGGCIWVDTAAALNDLACLLAKEVEFGVDTEQHTRRSFLGFTALLQISTGTQQDYIIDAIALHDHIHVLRRVFADPSIIKVFHGADSDVLWLQRDFHIYVVNLFDTARACDVLGKPHRSLAYLLREYCSVISDKQFQRADWRVRPLPPAMLNYARTDAHYLTYIAGKLRLELLQRDHQIPKINDGPHFPFLPVSSNPNGGGDHQEQLATYGPDPYGEVEDAGLGLFEPAPDQIERDGGPEEQRVEHGANAKADKVVVLGYEAAADYVNEKQQCIVSGHENVIEEAAAADDENLKQQSIQSREENIAEEDFTSGWNRAAVHGRRKQKDEETQEQGTANGESGSINDVGRKPGYIHSEVENDSASASGTEGKPARSIHSADNQSQRSKSALNVLQSERRGFDQDVRFANASSTAAPSAPQASRSESGLGKSTNYVQAVRRSHQVSLHLYDKELSHPSPGVMAASLLSRFYGCYAATEELRLRQGDACFQAVVRMLCKWRDDMARAEDESLRYVLSDTALLAIAARCPDSPDLLLSIVIASDQLATKSGGDPIPISSSAGTTSCSEADPSPSHIVRRHAVQLCSLISALCKGFQMGSGTDGPKRGNAAQEEGGTSDRSSVGHALLWRLLGIDGFAANKNEEGERFVREKLAGLACERKMGSRRWKRRDQARARELFVQKFACKAPVYHNCRIYAGDGRLLCFCDKKKLDWYIQRGLAELMDEDPPSVRLLFEPKGRPEDENNEFYIQSKFNQCVVCGESTHYLRYRIIPSCYRQHFPERLKSHRSHDIVLLCVDCHELAHKEAEKHKRKVALEFGVPLTPARIQDGGTTADHKAFAEGQIREGVPATVGGVNPTVLRRAAIALLRHGKTMPPERLKELLDVLREYYGRDAITMEDIENARLVGMGPRGQRRLHNHSSKGSVARKHHANKEAMETVERNGQDPAFPEGEERDTDDVGYSYPVSSSQHDELVEEEDRNDADDEAGSVTAGKEMEATAEGVIRERGRTWSRKPPEEILERAGGTVEVLEGDHNVDRAGVDVVEGSGKGKGRIGSDNEVMEMQSRRWQRKEAVLGHGHHGKKVVEMLTRQGGDDALRYFVQRWREVFVQALKPKFLPPAWDIKHSGRREFGEYSVYNPERKASERSVNGSTADISTGEDMHPHQQGSSSGIDDNTDDVKGSTMSEEMSQQDADQSAFHWNNVEVNNRTTAGGEDLQRKEGGQSSIYNPERKASERSVSGSTADISTREDILPHQ